MSEINLKLANGESLILNLDDLDSFYGQFVELFVKKKYATTNDWNRTLKDSISEIERISAMYQLSKGNLISNVLRFIERRLARDIAELPGNLDKIEILFENVEDYVENIKQYVLNGTSQEETRLNVSHLVENLNLFEISELLIFFAKKMNEC